MCTVCYFFAFHVNCLLFYSPRPIDQKLPVLLGVIKMLQNWHNFIAQEFPFVRFFDTFFLSFLLWPNNECNQDMYLPETGFTFLWHKNLKVIKLKTEHKTKQKVLIGIWIRWWIIYTIFSAFHQLLCSYAKCAFTKECRHRLRRYSVWITPKTFFLSIGRCVSGKQISNRHT